MHAGKTVLTTGEVAKLCNVAPRTVSKWFDSGRLRGYRIPGSKDRRIPIEQLVMFMRAHGMPLNGLGGGRKRVLVVDADAGIAEAIRTALTQQADYEVTTAGSAFEAGALTQETRPSVLILDITPEDVSPRAISRFVRSREELQDVCLIGMSSGMSEGRGQALLQQGFDGYISKPFETRSLIRLIEERSAMAAAS